MNIALIVMFWIAVISLLCAVVAAITYCDTLGAIATIIFCLSLCVIWTLGEINETKDTPSQPTALDVYRGKTTLEITYRDSVTVDSVVVYKVR